MLTRFVSACICAGALLFVVSLCGCNKSRTTATGGTGASEVVVVVNNAAITQDDLIASMDSYIPSQQNGSIPAPADRVVIAQLIQDRLVEGLSAKQKVAPTQQQIDDRYDDMKLLHDSQDVRSMDDELAESGLTVDKFKQLKLTPEVSQFNLLTQGQSVSEADIKAFYDKNKMQRFTESDRAHIKRIAFAKKNQADAIYDQIKTGGKMFEMFINQSAVKDPPDADLRNWIPTNAAKSPKLAPLCDAIAATGVGETSKPFFFRGGWWLVKVIDKEPDETLPESRVHHLIQWMLLLQMGTPARLTQYQQALKSYQAQAKITATNPDYSDIVEKFKTVATDPSSQSGGPVTQ